MYLSQKPQGKRKWTQARFDARKKSLIKFTCCICKKEIPSSEIPLEAKKKIGIQVYWHEKCMEKKHD